MPTTPVPFDLSTYRVDTALTRDGAWFALLPFLQSGVIRLAIGDEKPAVRICHSGHPVFQAVVQNCIEEEKTKVPDQGAAVVAGIQRATAQRLVTGWRGLVLDGQDIPYSPERCLELMRDDELPEFDTFVTTASRNLAHFRKKLEGRLGNSQSSSAGSTAS